MHVRTLPTSALAIAAALLLGPPSPASADEDRRVVVAEFAGPSPSSQVVRKAILEIVSDFYEVLPYSKYRVAQRRLNITQESMKTVSLVAQKVGADAIVEGVLQGRELTISVREGRTGRVVDRFKVVVTTRGVSAETRERITDELVDLIDWTEPVKSSGDLPGADSAEALRDPTGDDAPPATASLTTAPQPKPAAVATKKWTIDDVPTDGKAKADRRPPAIQVSTAVGVAATARQLAFSHQFDLADNERPLAMSGSPSPGVALAGTFDFNTLGISADAIYKRSIGASVSFPDDGMTKQVGITLSHIGARLLYRRPVSRRVTLRGGAGYHQIAFAISNRPTGMLMADSRYAYIVLGGGARLSLRDDRISLTGDVSYLYVINSGGITDAAAYGSSRFQGYGGEVGLEIDAGESSYVRLAGTFERFVLSFNGDGAWASELDDSSDVDVSGAADSFFGGVVMFGFRM